MPWLERELAIIRPALVVPLGRHALKHFAPAAKIGEVHGRVLAGAPDLFPLYHPAAAMYNQTLKATLFEDARALHAELVQRGA
jgi:DNA polymerase